MGITRFPVIPAQISDHGALGGLADDDHTQYHTDARGDARYAPITVEAFWTEIVKSADEAVNNSAVLQDDDDLQFAMVAGKIYEIEFTLLLDTANPAAADFKVVGYGVNISGQGLAVHYSAGDALTLSAFDFNTPLVHGQGGGWGEYKLYARGVAYCNANETFKIKWAQNAATVGDTIVKANSVLRYRLLN